jgi:hypothetical protein
MDKQRHNWISYLVIVSLVWLPVQYGQAMAIAHTMDHYKCQHCDSKQAQHHTDHHAKQGCSQSKVCDNEHNCSSNHHCAKCNLDKQVTAYTAIKHPAKQEILFYSASFSEFYPHPELRPPQV